MSTAAHFYKKVLKQPELAQVSFGVQVLDKYLEAFAAPGSSTSVKRTNTVGRVKTASWSLDFGISPDEKSIHVTLRDLSQKLPEAEAAHWLSNVQSSGFSENFLKMQGSHACIDDGGFRNWNEEEPLF